MSEKELVEKMVDSVERVPSQAKVLAVRQYSPDDIEGRTRRFLATITEAYGLASDRGDWVRQQNRTLIHMPLGARAVVYHASGAMKLVTGLNPMESLFEETDEREKLLGLVKETAERLHIDEWAGQNGSLEFERLWQIKAAASDRKGKAVEPVLCRLVGAYRHFVDEIPVWGAASVAIKLAGEGMLDSMAIQVRESNGEVIDQARILPPEQAARQILLQLSSVMSTSKAPLVEVAAPQWMRLGYLSLGKRKLQRLLAPVYVAAIEIGEQQEAQAHLFTTSATEKTYLPLCPYGSEASTAFRHRAH